MWALLFHFILLFSTKFNCLPIEGFVPFGNETSDTSLFRNDDGFAGPIIISTPFRFFETIYTSLFVNTNGLISFRNGVSQYTPQPFPLQNIIGVSPFWTDIDIRNGGSVFYREILDINLLKEIAFEIRRAFPLFYNYIPTWAYVTTWYQVPEYGQNTPSINNTFQAIIATNGIYSFTIYNYEELVWPIVNVSNRRAQAGFNAGDGQTYYIINGSFTQDILSVNSRSNVGIDGKWIFRVDRDNITAGGCSSSGFLSVTPVTQYYLGGENITLLGPCFQMNDSAQITYNYGYPGEEHVEICQIIDETSCTCRVPFLNRIGRVPIKLKLRENDTFLGWINSQDDPVRKEIYGIDAFYKSEQLNETLNITWDSKYSNLTNGRLGLFLATLQSDNKTVVYKQLSGDLSSTTNVTISLSDLFADLNLNQTAIFNYIVIRSVDQSKKKANIGSKALGALGKVLTLTRIPLIVSITAGLRCNVWHALNPDPQPFLDSLPPCIPSISPNFPSTLNGFTEDEACNPRNPFWCNFFHGSSKGCYRSTATGLNGAGQQCCYNEQGSLNIGPPSGGTLDTSTNKIEHFLQDVLPYLDCCILSDNCDKYYDKRPSDDGSRWRPPRPAGGSGDPHFTTLDNVKYTFNGWGEYTLLTIDNGLVFNVQVRIEPIRNSNTPTTQGTVFTGIAIKANNTDDIQLELNNGVLLGINGRLVDPEESQLSWLLNGVYIERLNSTYSFLYNNEISIKIEIDSTESFFYILMTVPRYYQRRTKGLLGVMDDNEQNEFTLPNGTYLSISRDNDREIFERFGGFWKNTPSNTIFTYYTGYSHSSYTNDAYVPLFLSDGPISFGNSTLESLARSKCGNNNECLFDVRATGLLEVGDSSLQFNKEISNLKEELSNISTLAPTTRTTTTTTTTTTSTKSPGEVTLLQRIWLMVIKFLEGLFNVFKQFFS